MAITVNDIFNAIPERFNGEAAGDWNATIQFDFSGGEGGDSNWYISVGDGSCTVTEGSSEGASATVKTSSDTWVGMVTGSVNAMQAFMTGQLTVKGNIADVMKLQDKRLFPTDR